MSWAIRLLIGITIAAIAVVFPWWVWTLALLAVTVWLHPYWEGVLLAILFDLLYGGVLEDTAFWTWGGLGIRLWMLYLVLFLILLIALPNRTRRQVY